MSEPSSTPIPAPVTTAPSPVPTPMTAQMPGVPTTAMSPATSTLQTAGVASTPVPATAQSPVTQITNGVGPGSSVKPGHHLDDEKKMELVAGMDPQKLLGIRKRVQDLQLAGHTRENSNEYAKLTMVLELYARAKRTEAAKLAKAATGESNAVAGPSKPAPPADSGPVPSNAVTMTPEQIGQLRAQVAAQQLLSRNQPVPEYMMQAAAGSPATSTTPIQPNTLENQVMAKTVEAVMSENIAKQDTSKSSPSAVPPKPSDAMDVDTASGSGSEGEKVVTPKEKEPIYEMEYDESSGLYPYNSYTHPATFAYRKFDEEVTNPLSKMQRMMVPSLMPKGLDPYLLMEERNRFVETRIAWRMRELEQMDATIGTGEQGAKDVPGVIELQSQEKGKNLGIQARIELLSLRLLGKQKLLREDLVRAMHGASQVPADRSQFRRFRTHTLRDARATESHERRQRTEREQRGKQKHVAYLNSITAHGQRMIEAGTSSSRGSTAEKMKRLGRAMLKMHADTEREEARRIERLAKERLKALKADDEDAYMALLGEAKDSRIGHLLKQTDSYLETLAAAVVDQQNDDVHRGHDQFAMPYEVEEGPANEAMFGARRQDGEEEGAEVKAGKIDYYAVAHRLQEKVTKQASLLEGGTLKDYQVKGLQWMISLYNNRLNGILADEMGLGKTIQTISLITYLIEKKRQYGPFIVIVPLSTLTNWTLEFERWAPKVKMLILKGSPTARKEFYPALRAVNFQVCLTTYEYIIKERPVLSKIKWIHMIIDEGHRMKNVKSKLSQTLNEFYSTRYRLILTGTPLQNNLPELWALLNFVLPKIFNSVKSFDEWFSAPFASSGGGEDMKMNEEEQLLVVKRLHKVLRPFLLRRLKKDVESELPDKVEKVIYTKMSGLQWALYRNVKQYKMLPMDTSAGKKRGSNLQNALMQLRKICNHPFVFREVDEDFSVGNNIDEQIVRTSGKFELLDRLLPKLFATGHKVLIFFQMTEIMTIIADFFDYRGWKYCRLDGSTKAEDRQTLLSTFNDPNSPYQVFILSTRAGGLGLNLQSADTVIIYDTDWNPHADLQAQDRAHRIGQKKEVRVLRLISSKTVEELVLERAQKKLELDGKVIQAGKFDDVTTGAEYEALLAKVFEAAGDEENEEQNELDDDELNELLARGDHELEIFARMDKEREAAQLEAWKDLGNKDPLPPPLMAESELPPFYRRDIGEELAMQVANEEEQGRGRRARAEVKYTDGLTDDQWLNAMEDSDDDVDEAADRKRKRSDKRAERKRMNEMLVQAEAEGKPLNTVKIKLLQEEDGVDGGVSTPKGGPKKRGRPSKSATPSVQGDDFPTKRRKIGVATDEEIAFMNRLYTEVNAMKSDMDEPLNTYFIKPVDKKMYPDYYQIIAQPISMNQIKRKIGTPSYSLSSFQADMHLLWNNARLYNQEGSWVYNAAEDMQEEFDKIWAEDAPKLENSNAADLLGNGGTNASNTGENTASAGPSGTSTPMFKGPAERIPVKLKIPGLSKRREEVDMNPSPEKTEEESSASESGDDDDY